MPNCSSSKSAICQHLPGDRTVQSHRFYTSRPTVTLRYSDITPTSVSDVVEQARSFPSRSTAALHFHAYYLSIDMPEHRSTIAAKCRHHATSTPRLTSPTSRPTPCPTRRRSRDTATTVDHGDAALYQRRRLVASTRDAASDQCRRFTSP